MESNGVRLPDNLLFPDDSSRPDLDALRIAKARQDISHRKLDRWIAAAIAELRDRATLDHPAPPRTTKARGSGKR